MAETIEILSKKVLKHLEDADKLIKQYKAANNTDKIYIKEQIKRRIDDAQTLLNTFDFNIDLIATDQTPYKQKKQELQEKINLLSINFRPIENGYNGKEETKVIAQKDLSSMTVKQLSAIAQSDQASAKEKLLGANKTIEGDITEQGNIIQLLSEGNDRIEYIDKNMSDIDSTLKRVGALLRYFARQVSTDKLLLTLIILAALGILAAILVKVFKK